MNDAFKSQIFRTEHRAERRADVELKIELNIELNVELNVELKIELIVELIIELNIELIVELIIELNIELIVELNIELNIELRPTLKLRRLEVFPAFCRVLLTQLTISSSPAASPSPRSSSTFRVYLEVNRRRYTTVCSSLW